MKFKRILCGITAAVTLCSLSAPFAAAEDARNGTVRKLLSVDFKEIGGGAVNFSLMGNNYFAYETAADDSGLDGIGVIDIDEWRSTGKFTYRMAETDFDLNGLFIGMNNSGLTYLRI